jgi:hypothetical protein
MNNLPHASPITLEYESLVARGLALTERQDTDFWALGALAGAVEAVYGDSTMDDFAARIKQRSKHLYECRDVWRTFSAYAEFRETHPALSWSHYREGHRRVKALGIEAVLDILDKAAINLWKVEMTMAEFIRAGAGDKKDTPRLKKIVKLARVIIDVSAERDCMVVAFPALPEVPDSVQTGEYFMTLYDKQEGNEE